MTEEKTQNRSVCDGMSTEIIYSAIEQSGKPEPFNEDFGQNPEYETGVDFSGATDYEKDMLFGSDLSGLKHGLRLGQHGRFNGSTSSDIADRY